MKAITKKQEVNSVSFADKLKSAICAINSMSYTDKARLYDKVISICREHVGDCADAVIMAYFIAIHDKFGFGAKRIKEIDDVVQPIIDETVDKYDIGTVYKLRNELRDRGFIYKLHCEKEKKDEQRESD